MTYDLGNMKIEPHEVTIPATRETFTAQVLVMTKEYKKMEYRGLTYVDASLYTPFKETQRVIEGGKFKVELVAPYMQPGTPTLIIYEEE